MKKYYFVPNNNLPEESEFYFIFEEEIKDFLCIELKDLKEFSEKYPNIILYKENVEEEIKDKETLKYLKENFKLEILIDVSKEKVFKLVDMNGEMCYLVFRKGDVDGCITLSELKKI